MHRTVAVAFIALVLASGHTSSAGAKAAPRAICKAEQRLLEAAEAGYFSQKDRYATIEQLVKANYMFFKKGHPPLHKIKVLEGGADFEVVPVKGKCA